jgi:hypothetical protein
VKARRAANVLEMKRNDALDDAAASLFATPIETGGMGKVKGEKHGQVGLKSW